MHACPRTPLKIAPVNTTPGDKIDDLPPCVGGDFDIVVAATLLVSSDGKTNIKRRKKGLGICALWVQIYVSIIWLEWVYAELPVEAISAWLLSSCTSKSASPSSSSEDSLSATVSH